MFYVEVFLSICLFIYVDFSNWCDFGEANEFYLLYYIIENQVYQHILLVKMASVAEKILIPAKSHELGVVKPISALVVNKYFKPITLGRKKRTKFA